VHTFQQLETLLELFESRQFNAILQAGVCRRLPQSASHGIIQSVALDSLTANAATPLPTVSALGINFWQDSAPIPGQPPVHLLSPPGATSLTIVHNLSEMRRALDFALGAYRRNIGHWLGTSAITVPDLSNGYHLIAVNRSPFITTKSWSELRAWEQRGVLAAWPETPHLNAFDAVVGPGIDLSVGHGSTFVWPAFRCRITTQSVSWLLTYNLSGLGLAQMKAANSNPNHPAHRLYQ
jgi:hypothetical protein